MKNTITRENWEVEINRPQRAAARRKALKLCPLIRTPHIWGEGSDVAHIIIKFTDLVLSLKKHELSPILK